MNDYSSFSAAQPGALSYSQAGAAAHTFLHGSSRLQKATNGIVDALIKQARQRPGATALTYEGDSFSYERLEERTSAIALQLRSLGLNPGDRVGLLFPNEPDLVACFFAVLSVGATVVPVNPLLKSDEIAHILSDSGASAFIVHPSALSEVEGAVRGKRTSVRHVLVSNPSSAESDVLCDAVSSTLRAGVEVRKLTGTTRSSVRLDEIATSVDPVKQLALIMYTSGTTGKPKGAMITHNNLMSVVPLPIFRGVDVSSSDRWLGVLPMCHIYGVGVLVYASIAIGSTLIIVPKFDARTILEIIEREQVTLLPAVPSMYQFMLMEMENKKYDLSSVRMCFCAAAPLSMQLFKRIEATFNTAVIEGYALTESACGGTINTATARRMGSIGMALPNIDVTIRDEDGNLLPAGAGHVGEIVLRGPNIMAGYHNQPEATAAVIRDGWLFTGDLGYKDEEGYFYIVGRKKELIIRGGQNIYPREIEEIIVRMPEVREVAVIGIPDELMGERVKAFVVLQPGSNLNDEEVKSYCAKHLAPYKVPRLVEFRSELLPRNSTGKVLKRVLAPS